MITYQEFIQADVKVVLEDIGEGWNGDYDLDDPQDQQLLRFSVLKRDGEEWTEVENASYCTGLPITITETQARITLESLMREVFDKVQASESIKKICEWFSWVGLKPQGKIA